jgi:hypothetical protein
MRTQHLTQCQLPPFRSSNVDYTYLYIKVFLRIPLDTFLKGGLRNGLP